MEKKPNVNFYWNYVKELYPDARFSFWYSSGELHFYPNGGAEERDDPPMSCFRKNGQYVIKGDF